jgi:hypothetical protein
MPNHAAACPKSATWCNQLFRALRLKIPDLQVKNDNGWCSMWNTGGVIAWVSHNRIRGGVTIWFRGDLEKAKKISAQSIMLKITPLTGVWCDCCGSFTISKADQLAEAAEVLFEISYPLTLNLNWLGATFHKEPHLLDPHPVNEQVYRAA